MTDSVVDQSIKLLAERLVIDPAEIRVARSIEVTWRDGSIGCPEPGFMYTQALVPGTLIELVVDGVMYAFHQAGDRPPFYCPNSTEPNPS